MKKLLIALAFAGMGTAANAQTTQIEAPSKYTVATNSFWSNWYIQLGADMSVFHVGSGLVKDDWHNGRTYGVDLAVGKWFTPGLGLRAKAQWENGAFMHAFRNTDHVNAPNFEDGGYGAAYMDVQFNLSNLFAGYSDTRVWNLIAYPRAGVARDLTDKGYCAVLGAGVENTWKLSKRVGIYLDLAYNLIPTNEFYANTTKGGERHIYATADLGLTVNLGKTGFEKAVTLSQYNALAAASEEALAKLRAELDRERARNAELQAELQRERARKTDAPARTESVVAATTTSVFFDINSSSLNSKKDLINLEAVATAAKASGAKLLVTGSADSKTGSSAWNQKLSESRAKAVADELVRLGVNRDNIEVKAVGGVNEVSPYTLNRRAVISFK